MFGVAAGISALGGIIGYAQANKAQKEAKTQEGIERAKMDRLERAYMSLDTSNPYLNMENTMEDLTVNQQAAQFEAQQFQQSQANILDATRGAAGGSGVAAIAQALSQQGQIAAQRASASIGQQEAANQRAAASQAASIQQSERQGEIISRNLEREQTGTALGMAQARTAQRRQEVQMAEQAKFNAIQGGIQGISSAALAGLGGGATTLE